MANSKRNQLIRRSGFQNMLLSIVISSISLMLLNNYAYSFVFLFFVVTFSTLNILNINYKGFLSMIFTKFRFMGFMSNFDILVVTLAKNLMVFSISVFTYYVIAVLFGATVFHDFWATLYFSCFMTLLTVYPLCMYCWFDDTGVTGLQHIFIDSKHDSISDACLYSAVMWSVVGAWLGAFPIPLDWDRPWQEWPTTCCIGAVLGYAASHLYIGSWTLWGSYKEKRKLPWNMFV